MHILDEYENLGYRIANPKEVEIIVKATNYIKELVAPYGWEFKGSGNGAAFENSDGHYFSFDSIGWKEVRKILEQHKDSISRTAVEPGGGTGAY